MFKVKYCPCCKKEIKSVGFSGIGTIYYCSKCDEKFIIAIQKEDYQN